MKNGIASFTRFLPCRPVILFTCAFLLSAAVAASPSQASQGSRTAQKAPAPPVAAVVNGHPIKASEVESFAAQNDLPREDALEELIDLYLIGSAAAAKHVITPAGKWSEDQRDKVEFALARALGLGVPPVRVLLVVDHAWVKDADNSHDRAAARLQMERLRAMLQAGATITGAYERLNVEGAPWHIGDHEEYEYDVIPAQARDLTPGSISPILPGDGGLHLFKIYQRKEEYPPRDEVRVPLLSRLRQEAKIERREIPDAGAEEEGEEAQ